MADEYTGFVVLFAVILIGFMFAFLRGSKSKRMIEAWAAENGYTIVKARRKTFLRGPFWLTTGRGQEVYRVFVIDSAGNALSGWVRLGSLLVGLMSARIDVRWDK